MSLTVAAGPPALSTGALDAFVLAPPVLLGLLYARRARTLAPRGQAPPRWRQCCFYAGLTLVGALIAFGRIRRELLFVTMIEHLLLSDVGSLLIVLGLTPGAIAPLMRNDALRRLSVLSNPLIAFPLWAVDLFAWHQPSLYQAALEHAGLNVAQRALFVLCGANMWMCLCGPLPTPSWFGNTGRFVYILAVRLAAATLANIFLWSGTVFYLDYLHADAVHHISPLADQNLAGAILLVESTLFTIGLFIWMFRRSARESRERHDLLELARSRGVALSEKRVARAIASGRASELRNRLEQRAETLF